MEASRQPAPLAALRRFFVVPHTHWDREWYLPFEEFQLRLAAVVDEILDVLEQDPSFASFTLDGQAIVLEDYLEARPENEERLRALITAGRLEVGPSYMLPDEFLVGGESLVRNLLLGRIVCERYGASPSPVGYLPDSFGHPLQLPQILAGFGIESFIFSRGMGDEVDEVGIVFRWRAPDGSEVRAIQQLPSYSNFSHVGDAIGALERLDGIANWFGDGLARAGVHEVLLCAGDDHVRVRRDLPALCAELERRLPGTEFTIAKYSDYVDALDTPDLPVFAGELLGSRIQNVLRGVNSARLYLKQANERAECRLLAAETLTALVTLHTGERFPVSDFRMAWSRLLRCQPHDSICGCSCDEVHRDMLVRYEALDRTVRTLQRRATATIVSDASADAPAIGVANVLPERRRALLEVAGMEPVVVELDGFSARTIHLTRAAASVTDLPTDGTSIESDMFRVEAAHDGTLTVIDRGTGQRFEGLHRLEDELDMGDLYNFCPVEGATTWTSDCATARVLRAGPTVWELELRVTAERPAGLDGDLRPEPELCPLTVTTVARLIQGVRRVEFRTTLENTTRDHRLRVVFPVGETSSSTVRAEGQFALVDRPMNPPGPQTEWVEPPDSTHHTLGAVALGPLALLTRGLPEYEARPASPGPELCLTLLRAVGLISRPTGAIATRPLGAGPQVLTPEGQCFGHHELEYALLPGADDLDAVALLRASQDYRSGFTTVAPAADLDPPIALDGDAVFSCLKGAEDGDGLILRCFNPGKSGATAHVAGNVTVSRTRLDETVEVPLLSDQPIELAPGEIVTLRIR